MTGQSNKKNHNGDESDSSSDNTDNTSFDELTESDQRKLIFEKLLNIEHNHHKLFKSLTNDIKGLKEKVASLEKRNLTLREEIECIQQGNQSNSVVFYGVPTENEISDIELVKNIGTKLDLNV